MADKKKPESDTETGRAEDNPAQDTSATGAPDESRQQPEPAETADPADTETEAAAPVAPPAGDVAEAGDGIAVEIADTQAEFDPAPDPADAPTPEPDVAPEPVVTEKPAVQVVERRGGFGAALIGGILAAALGFFAARSAVLDPWLPEALRGADNTQAIAALQDELASQGEAVAALRSQAEANPPPDLAPIRSRLDDLSNRLAPVSDGQAALASQVDALSSSLDDIAARLTEVEKRPISEGVSDAAIAAYERELEAMRNAVATQRAEVEGLIDQARKMEAEARAMEKSAAEQARKASVRAVASRLRATLDAGAPYGAILDELSAGGVSVPDALSSRAQDGVATMAALRESFPPAARAALTRARADGAGNEGVGDTIKRFLGARSVAPRAGGDPDAVLSRAEAALIDGQLDTALGELEALPEVARAEMADWIAQATARQEAVAAAESLVQTLNTN